MKLNILFNKYLTLFSEKNCLFSYFWWKKKSSHQDTVMPKQTAIPITYDLGG